jgi:hypothetical protein
MIRLLTSLVQIALIAVASIGVTYIYHDIKEMWRESQ